MKKTIRLNGLFLFPPRWFSQGFNFGSFAFIVLSLLNYRSRYFGLFPRFYRTKCGLKQFKKFLDDQFLIAELTSIRFFREMRITFFVNSIFPTQKQQLFLLLRKHGRSGNRKYQLYFRLRFVHVLSALTS